MTDINLPQKGTGDALSQMLQIAANMYKLENIRWTGTGSVDLENLLRYARHLQMGNKELMHALARVADLPEIRKLCAENEAVAAQISLFVLQGRAVMDIKVAQAAAVAQAPNPGPGARA